MNKRGMSLLSVVRTLIVLIAYSVISTLPLSSKTISIDETLTKKPIGLYIQYLEDKKGNLTFEEIKSGKPEAQWTASNTEKPGLGFTKSAYWVRFDISNVSGIDIDFFLEFSESKLLNIDLYIPEEGAYRVINAGALKPFHDRPYEHRTFVFPLKLKSKSHAAYYMRCKIDFALTLNLNIYSIESFRKNAVSEYMLLVIFYAIILVMSAYNLFMFFFIRRIEYLYYTIFVVFDVLFWMTIDGTSFQFLWPNHPQWENFCLPLLLNLMMLFIVLFCNSLVDLKGLAKKAKYLSRLNMIGKGWVYTFIMLCISSLFLPFIYAIAIGSIITAILLTYIGAVGAILIIKEKSRPALWGIISASAVIVGSISYSLKSFGLLQANFFTEWSAHIGNAAMAILFSIALADRINIMRKDLTVLNNDLEEKVGERTEELQAAMEEVKAMNDMLVETNDSLEESQRIAQLDMKMAANVQASLFPGEAPKIKNWDIAFKFKPMSGVSGDMYDFYQEDDRLAGVALFDVSGHGISSGLITMIARSAFFRNFHKGKDSTLNRILERANKDMINEIGSTDKYLTGMLLRFSENSIEYVNAAHPDLLCRSSATGKVNGIKSEDKDFKGMFIGVEGVDGIYGTMTYETNTGDFLLLYSDCIYESRNSMGEEYGLERVKVSVEKAPGGSARQMLDYIVKDFYDFVGRDKLNDDFTVIVLKKTV